MGMDADLITYSAYSELAWAEYLGNDKLQESVQEKYETVSGWRLGNSLAQLPSIALDYLYEATMAYSFGFFRSSIFCCAAVLDIDLKRILVEYSPDHEKRIKSQTLGQSIGLLKQWSRPNSTRTNHQP